MSSAFNPLAYSKIISMIKAFFADISSTGGGAVFAPCGPRFLAGEDLAEEEGVLFSDGEA
jgi:hypothetical protein